MRIYQDDCFNILSTLPKQSIDLLLTDPPYGQSKIHWDTRIDWNQFWESIHPIMKPTGIVLMFGIQPMVSELIMSNPNEYRYDIIWSKSMPTGYLDANRKPLRAHEHILFFSKQFKDTTYNPQKIKTLNPYRVHKRKPEDGASQYAKHERTSTLSDGDKYPTSVIHFSNQNNNSQHSTQKPLSILIYLLLQYSHPKDIILDPFMGSASTGVAALQNDRDFIGIEKDESIFRIAQERIQNESNQLKICY